MSWRDIVKAKKLTPKQEEALDHNHNGVIDAQDFHIMNGAEKKSCGPNCNCKKCGETEKLIGKSPDKTHYTKDGKVWTGETHKTKGQLMTGKTHTDESVNLFHKDELPKSSPRSVFTR
tara:strand:- start:202 stop:555 length:354 start_codon:yes stop_codon:yes gene_type:complete